jgi:hypothetical protein
MALPGGVVQDVIANKVVIENISIVIEKVEMVCAGILNK